MNYFSQNIWIYIIFNNFRKELKKMILLLEFYDRGSIIGRSASKGLVIMIYQRCFRMIKVLS